MYKAALSLAALVLSTTMHTANAQENTTTFSALDKYSFLEKEYLHNEKILQAIQEMPLGTVENIDMTKIKTQFTYPDTRELLLQDVIQKGKQFKPYKAISAYYSNKESVFPKTPLGWILSPVQIPLEITTATAIGTYNFLLPYGCGYSLDKGEYMCTNSWSFAE